MFQSGTITEGWRIEAIVSKQAKTINLMEGCAFVSEGYLSEHETQFYFIAPQELLSDKT